MKKIVSVVVLLWISFFITASAEELKMDFFGIKCVTNTDSVSKDKTLNPQQRIRIVDYIKGLHAIEISPFEWESKIFRRFDYQPKLFWKMDSNNVLSGDQAMGIGTGYVPNEYIFSNIPNPETLRLVVRVFYQTDKVTNGNLVIASEVTAAREREQGMCHSLFIPKIKPTEELQKTTWKEFIASGNSIGDNESSATLRVRSEMLLELNKIIKDTTPIWISWERVD